MPDSWVSIIEYARQNNVSDMTVRRRIKMGRLNAELRDGKYFIPMKGGAEKAQVHHQEHNSQDLQFEIDLSPSFEEEKKLFTPNLKTSDHPTNKSQSLDMQLERLAENFEIAIDQIKQRELLLKENFESERKFFVSKTNLAEKIESAIDQIKQRELLLKSNFDIEKQFFAEKLNFMETEIRNRDNEIKSLKKEIEDLEVLVKVFEEKVSS